MGEVLRARDTRLGRDVAIKILPPGFAANEEFRTRFEREARTVSSLNHPNICTLFDVGEHDGATFLVMELLEGEPLRARLGQARASVSAIVDTAIQLADALEAAHAKGVVHRDIKPENVFLLRRKEQDFVKVVDFGISKSLRASDEQEEPQRLTQTGMVLGTPLYMSPEQARGDDELDHRVDLYALGVIMYEASTGRVPFSGNNYLSVISQVLNESPQPPREIRPELSDEFEAIVLKAMAKDRKDRYASADEMLADLNALLDDPTHSTERAKITGPRKKLPSRQSANRYLIWVGGIAVIVVGLTFTVMQLMKSSPAKKQPVVGGDAGVAAQMFDAGVAPPSVVDAAEEVKTIEISFESEPKGAEVSIGGAIKGKTPITLQIVLTNKEVTGSMMLAGYDEQPIAFNPLELSKEKSPRMLVKLKKPKGGAPIRLPKNGAGSGSGGTQVRPNNNTNPDWGANPFTGSGNVPQKK